MTTAWRIPLSAHVCTTEDAPAIQRAALYLIDGPLLQDHSQLLRKKLRSLKYGSYTQALITAQWALDLKTTEWIQACQERNGLLHYGVPKATALAQATYGTNHKGVAAC